MVICLAGQNDKIGYGVTAGRYVRQNGELNKSRRVPREVPGRSRAERLPVSRPDGTPRAGPNRPASSPSRSDSDWPDSQPFDYPRIPSPFSSAISSVE